ncbi:TIGR03086 family metal-binding protein [Salinactinospora qingdaonensis]|uniref:TIGR03086 family metal-binding protein n=1 Tax=Salinactinospora qingdaonensis TaxID=702744 RepID=A0ABP7F3K7_9ACTN
MMTVIDLEPSARRLTDLLGTLADSQLWAPTPCEGYRVRDLLAHLLDVTSAFRDAATKVEGAAAAPSDATAAELDPHWRETLPRSIEAMVFAWRDPAAWEGTARAGGRLLPAPIVGRIAAGELLLHGWDLARATEQPFSCDSRTAEASLHVMSLSANDSDQRERQGLFGPPVEVSADASLLDRTIAMSGRNPQWAPI